MMATVMTSTMMAAAVKASAAHSARIIDTRREAATAL
jgi:hypothetical protein